MNREILFRGKRVDNDEWIESKGLMIHSDGTVIMILSENETGFTTTPVIPETVCQFTGATDKNGVRIFEGDILTGLGAVEWMDDIRNCGCYFQVHATGFDFEDDPSNLEITGNIHDNGTAK